MLRAFWRAGRPALAVGVLVGFSSLPLWLGSGGSPVVPAPVVAALNRSTLATRVQFSPEDLHVDWQGEAPRVRLGAPGSASLPVASGASWPAPVVYLVLPEGMAPAGVRVEGLEPVDLAPALAANRLTGLAAEIPTESAARGEVAYEGWMRGQRVVGVRLRPMGRDPLSGGVRLWQTLNVTLALRPGARPDGVFVPRRSDAPAEGEFRAALRSLVANPADVADEGGPGGEGRPERSLLAPAAHGGGLTPTSFSGDNYSPRFRPSLEGGAVSMVIITNEALTPEYQRLAEWRTRTGDYTVIRTVSWIAANYPEGVDLADSIRRFIKDAAALWGTGYVLLGGDSDIVPVRYGRTTYFGGEDIPTDMYYQCLERSWNENGNSKFGEGLENSGGTNTGDEADLMPDVWISRIPLSSPQGVKAVIDKTFQIERTPPIHTTYISSFLCLAEMLQPSNWNPGELVLYDGAELGEAAIASLPPGTRVTRMYENTADPRWSGTALPENKSAVIDSVNAGYSIVHHVGHGFRNNVSVGLGGKEIDRSDADALTNRTEPFLFYGINCNSASFDFECIAEHFLANPNGGAFAYVGSTRFDFPGHSEDYQGGFYNSLLNGHTSVAEAHARQKFVRVSESLRDGADRWTQLTLVCLGDPLVRLGSENPVALGVSRPASVTLGQPVTVSVTRSGVPLAGARVTLYRAAELFVTDTTNAAGEVALACPAELAGDVSLTVTAVNSVPWEGTVNLVAPVAAAYLRVTDLSILDDPATAAGIVGNHDGHLDPGETADLRFTVQNGGGGVASNVTLTFGSGAGGLSVLHATTDLAPLATGASGSTPLTQSIRVSVAPLVSAPTTINGSLTLAWGGGGRVDPVVLHVGGVNLWVMQQSIVDDPGGPGSNGVVAPGELVQLTHSIRNRGLSVARDVHLRLVSTDARVTLGTADLALGDLAPGADVVAPAPLSFSVSDLAALPGLAFVIEAGGVERLRMALDVTPPGAPSTPIAQPQSRAITLSWSRLLETDLRGYAVYRATEPAGPFTHVNPIIDNPMSFYVDAGLSGFTKYYYQLAAQDRAGNLGPRSPTLSTATSFASLPNFPLERQGGTPTSPIVHDLDGDQVLEVIIGGEELYAMHADGTEYTNGDADSRTLGLLTQTNRATFWGTPVVADLNNDGILEIVAAGWSDGNLWVFGADGRVAPGWPRKVANVSGDCNCSALWASACVADVDGDHRMEIFIPGGHVLYGFHDDGREIRDGDNDPATVGVFAELGSSYNYGSPAAGDMDGDSAHLPEIVIGTRRGDLHVFKADGSEPAGWPKQWLVNGAPAPIISSPALADLDSDGKPEIVIAVQQPRNKVEAVDIDGKSPPGWPVGILVNQDFNASPTVGDINKDGHLDVVMVGGSGRVSAWRGDNGQPLFPSVDLEALEGATEMIVRGTPCLGDVTGDGLPDILIGTNKGSVWGIDATGQPLPGFPMRAQDNVEGGIVIWDVDGDNKNELLFGSFDKNLYIFRTLGLFDVAGGALPWPMFRHDQFNSGNFTVPLTTPVEPALASFTARSTDAGVVLEWQAAAAAGDWTAWNVYREDSTGERRLNSAPLPGAAHLTFRDGAAAPGAHYVYRVEGVDRAGRTTRFAPLVFTVPDAGVATLLLRQNAPNPFRSATTIAYRVPPTGAAAGAAAGRLAPRSVASDPGAAAVRLEILDVQGRRVRLLQDGAQPPGDYSLTWDGRDDSGAALAGGLYFFRLRVADLSQTRKMLLTR